MVRDGKIISHPSVLDIKVLKDMQSDECIDFLEIFVLNFLFAITGNIISIRKIIKS